MDYYAPRFHRATFVERNDISESVVSTFENDLPFTEITIPASGIGMPLTSSTKLGSSIFWSWEAQDYDTFKVST